MDENELQIKQEETTINGNAEKLHSVSNTKKVTKHRLSQQLIVEKLLKSKLLHVARGMFIKYEKEIDESKQIIRSFEKNIGDDKVKNDVLNKVSDNNIKENGN